MKGQGIIEAVYSIGVLGMILTGAVVLILMSSTLKKSDFDRKKATEMGTMIIEELIYNSKNDVNFWNLNNSADLTKTDFPNYTYSTEFTNITGNVSYPNCGVGVTDCAEAKVIINWDGKVPQQIIFNRFFTKNGY